MNTDSLITRDTNLHPGHGDHVGPPPADSLIPAYRRTRAFSIELAAPLATEDCVVQSMPDASPIKWHLAHTSWFFDTLLLQPMLGNIQTVTPDYTHLFNAYHDAAAPMHCRHRRGVLSRPTLAETLEYRRHVDRHVERLLTQATPRQMQEVVPLLVLGLNHEQQHQELMLTDIKHAFAQNPLHPVYLPADGSPAEPAAPVAWQEYAEGVYWIGTDDEGSFAFGHEGPRHRAFLEDFALADRPVTNGEYAEFIEDGGYQRPELWLSPGWAAAQQHGWNAPLYWHLEDDLWHEYTLAGQRPINDAEPVCHISYFEADAYARWSGARLPTEAEWEVAVRDMPVDGNFVEQGFRHPRAAPSPPGPPQLRQTYGDVWEWTRSSYAPYPGYTPTPGAIGEYNGKFMCNQMVLRGGSCVTSRSHMRATYRNFFAPEKRWQFSGVRLARDAA